MNYDVQIPLSVERAINSWDLDEALKIQLYETIERDLSSLPVGSFRRVVAPVRRATHRFTLTNHETGLVHAFFLWINDHEKPDTRIVTDIKWLV
jgi:hypothetical protein